MLAIPSEELRNPRNQEKRGRVSVRTKEAQRSVLAVLRTSCYSHCGPCSSFGPRSTCRRIPACGTSIWTPLQAIGAAERQMMTEQERTTLKLRWGDKGEAGIVEFVKARMLWP
jgi:hypothetical protein